MLGFCLVDFELINGLSGRGLQKSSAGSRRGGIGLWRLFSVADEDEATWKERSGLSELRAVPAQKASNERGPQSYKYKELKIANTLIELGSKFFLRASREEANLINTLISVF